ncbi:hypothetical protein FOA52_010887 [Chlamydomonas sp. UWO 241]|nr:hypothetical protein FOA52_010887 [Chlamydomonas sp. UWO 241]
MVPILQGVTAGAVVADLLQAADVDLVVTEVAGEEGGLRCRPRGRGASCGEGERCSAVTGVGVCWLTNGLGEAAAAGLKAVEAVASAAADGGAAVDASDVSAARGPLQKSCAAVKLLLDAKHPGWHLRSGLEQVACKSDGLCEWVLPKYAEEFGGDMLGVQSKSQAPDPGAAQRAVQEASEPTPQPPFT